MKKNYELESQQIKNKVSTSIMSITKSLTENFGLVSKITASDRAEINDYILLAIEHHHNLEEMSERKIDDIVEYVSVNIILRYLSLFLEEDLQETREKFKQFFSKSTSNKSKIVLLNRTNLRYLIPKNASSVINYSSK